MTSYPQRRSDSGSGMVKSAMVSNTIGEPDRLPHIADNTSRYVEEPIQRQASSDGSPQVVVSRLETVRKRHKANGISEEASKLIASGWSKGNNVAYQSAWDKWSSWCHGQQIDPISCEVHFIVNFLAELYKQELQQRSINTIRSAVSMTHSQVEGIPIGQHPLVSRLMKGVYNHRLPQPQYAATWNIDVVVAHSQSLRTNSDLSLKQLFHKWVILMVLVEASQSSELGGTGCSFPGIQT